MVAAGWQVEEWQAKQHSNPNKPAHGGVSSPRNRACGEHELVCGTCCPCVVPGTPAAVTQNPIGSAKRYVSTDLPGVRGVPTCDLRCATRLPLYALALSTVAPPSSASPLYGHPVSAMTMSTPLYPLASSAARMASSCASNMLVSPDPASTRPGFGWNRQNASVSGRVSDA
uniref:Uncharacterized protein n=1 Tax=Oryza meridionalis TaxID=40149 RepID=A0A0E0CXG3_9ORYZ